MFVYFKELISSPSRSTSSSTSYSYEFDMLSFKAMSMISSLSLSHTCSWLSSDEV